MVKSSSVGAPEPEKLQKNKVGPIIWDTLYYHLGAAVEGVERVAGHCAAVAVSAVRPRHHVAALRLAVHARQRGGRAPVRARAWQ